MWSWLCWRVRVFVGRLLWILSVSSSTARCTWLTCQEFIRWWKNGFLLKCPLRIRLGIWQVQCGRVSWWGVGCWTRTLWDRGHGQKHRWEKHGDQLNRCISHIEHGCRRWGNWKDHYNRTHMEIACIFGWLSIPNYLPNHHPKETKLLTWYSTKVDS